LSHHWSRQHPSNSYTSDGNLKLSSSLSGSLTLPPPAIPEENAQSGSGVSTSHANVSVRNEDLQENLELLEEQLERDLASGLHTGGEGRGVSKVEKDLVKGLQDSQTSGEKANRPRSNTAEAQLKAAGK
jgi:hypothetical protein